MADLHIFWCAFSCIVVVCLFSVSLLHSFFPRVKAPPCLPNVLFTEWLTWYFVFTMLYWFSSVDDELARGSLHALSHLQQHPGEANRQQEARPSCRIWKVGHFSWYRWVTPPRDTSEEVWTCQSRINTTLFVRRKKETQTYKKEGHSEHIQTLFRQTVGETLTEAKQCRRRINPGCRIV